MTKPLILIIRDGWGIAPKGPGNAVTQARTPYHDAWQKKYPRALLEASGTAIGLPQGFQGNSEVGHLTIGAGRPVKQEMTYIHEAIADGSFFENKTLRAAYRACKEQGSTLHLIGILQDAGVHAHINHLFALLQYAKDMKLARIMLHILADGRDSSPRSVMDYYKQLREKFPDVPVGTLTGRYYLDRGGHWQITETLYRALVFGDALAADSVGEAVADAYMNHHAPGEKAMWDEFIPPYRLKGFDRIAEGDTVIFFNFRQDRMIQLTRAFVEHRFGGPEVRFLTLTRPYDEFTDYLFAPHAQGKGLVNVLGEAVSQHHMRQLRVADGQKFRHVTSFLNGKRVAPFPGEDRLEIKLGPSAMYKENPGMGAREIAEVVPPIIRHGVYDLIVINFANADMVGHVGEIALAVRAAEIVDACAGRVVDAALEHGSEVIVTSDHGNIEQMMDGDKVRTAHTINPVDLFYISSRPNGALAATGILPSIGPTLLDLLGVAIPPEMTAPSLLQK